ncbi:hypothetical protein TNCT_559081 [Trichonephila clavata]|uniref:Uncharacterized protein n=1 Tax=Trichonephila clavata TaxID=2740835 RepID=A0A8X6HCD2_TRICU|nr:hypothetical protein TNCT_559081 [Trichonephila clavata]
MKKIEITGIKLPTGETTSSLDETINAVLQKSFLLIQRQMRITFRKTIVKPRVLLTHPFFDPPLSCDEVNTVVPMLKFNKSAGPDSISNEIIKQFHLAFPSFLHKLFNVCLDLGIFPRV